MVAVPRTASTKTVKMMAMSCAGGPITAHMDAVDQICADHCLEAQLAGGVQSAAEPRPVILLE